jgi:hypothetical protein
MVKEIKTAVEKDLMDMGNKPESDLIKAMTILHSNENLESNTILDNFQVNGLALMNWASQVYDIQFFKHYVALFPKYRISGDDGRGRKELIQIAEAIQRDKAMQQDRMLEIFNKR